MPGETDAKILTASPLGELEETTGTPSYYVDEDYPARPEIQQPLREWSNWRGTELSTTTLETDVYVWCHTLLEVHATEEKKKSITVELRADCT